MNRTIYKYPVPAVSPGAFEIELPASSRVVAFGDDLDGELCVWAWIDPTEKEMHRQRFVLVWTGQHVGSHTTWLYVGRAVHDGLIWHLLAAATTRNIVAGAVLP